MPLHHFWRSIASHWLRQLLAPRQRTVNVFCHGGQWPLTSVTGPESYNGAENDEESFSSFLSTKTDPSQFEPSSWAFSPSWFMLSKALSSTARALGFTRVKSRGSAGVVLKVYERRSYSNSKDSRGRSWALGGPSYTAPSMLSKFREMILSCFNETPY